MNLTSAQQAALKYIDQYASRTETLGEQDLANVLAMSNISTSQYDQMQKEIKTHARIGLHFHPDRLDRQGRTVVEALLADGRYKNQFETHLSSGGLDPSATGRRAGWEDQLFGASFTTHNAALSERPKYGALHLMGFPDGPCPRFGSCYFLTNSTVLSRATFTYMDSHRNPPEKGTIISFEPILAALMSECFERRFALGAYDISPPDLCHHLLTSLSAPFENPASLELGRNLNHYIEAQIHGNLFLAEDVSYLVADPSFKGTPIEGHFYRLCDAYQIELFWHSGFRLSVSDVPDNFRGSTMPSLAKRVARGDYVDAFAIGVAAADLRSNPNRWANRGSYRTVLQELKLLWHVLVQYGDMAKG